MIIVEGPDGAGKSTLVERLQLDTGLPLHERASDSLTGPVSDLWGWVCRDLGSWDTQPLALYDRHPMISEYVYGPITRGKLPMGFIGASSRKMLQQLQQQALVIFCLPAPYEVITNVRGAGGQMSGVVDNIRAIYHTYAGTQSNWGGWSVHYDYTRESGKGSYETVLRAVRLHSATFRKA